MAHPQHNFTSNFNGSDGHNAELTLNINGVEKKYTPAGNDQTYNVPGVARIDINLDGADLVQAIQTALDGAAQPVLAEMSVYDEEVVYQYIGDMDGCWNFGLCTVDIIITLAVDKTDGSIGSREIPVANGVVIVPTDGLAIYSQLRSAIALGQLPVLSYVGANPVYAQYEKTADNGDLVFVGAFATKSTPNRIQCIIYKVASDNTITTETYASFSGAYNDLTGKPDIKKNKIHRYSFGNGTVDGETPVYGSWLIDLDKPDPNGPEGYARVTPAELWNTITINEEVPVYLQDKNADNSLTYAYLSRADVTKSGIMVTNVFMFFVRSGYGNQLKASYGFKFTKLDGSDYIQKAAYDTAFDALSDDGDSGMTKPTFTTAQAVANIASGERLKVMLGKIAKWFTDFGTAAFKALVTSWSGTPSNDNIPSEKLVKDSLDTKLSTDGLKYTPGINLARQHFIEGSVNTSVNSDNSQITISPADRDTHFTFVPDKTIASSTVVTISFDVEYSGSDDGNFNWPFAVRNSSVVTITGSGRYYCSGALTVDLTKGVSAGMGFFDDGLRPVLPQNSFVIKNIKLELGEVPTGFSLAPADVAFSGSYNDLSNKPEVDYENYNAGEKSCTITAPNSTTHTVEFYDANNENKCLKFWNNRIYHITIHISEPSLNNVSPGAYYGVKLVLEDGSVWWSEKRVMEYGSSKTASFDMNWYANGLQLEDFAQFDHIKAEFTDNNGNPAYLTNGSTVMCIIQGMSFKITTIFPN